jgi:hypothetical protein
MSKGTWLLMGLLALPVGASVYERHDKWPAHEHGVGDCDADDPCTKGVPEPGTLGLLALGIGGLVWVTRRRR